MNRKDGSYKKVSIMIDVKEDYYQSFIEPLKQEKKLKVFLEALFSSYCENEEVQGVVEGVLDGRFKETTDALGASLMKMKASLSAMGMVTEEAIRTANEGVDEFKDATPKAKKGGTSDFVTKGEFTELKDMMKEVLKAVSGGTVVARNEESVEEKPLSSNNNTVVHDDVYSDVDEGELDDILGDVDYSELEAKMLEGLAEEPKLDESEVLGNLLDGQVYSF